MQVRAQRAAMHEIIDRAVTMHIERHGTVEGQRPGLELVPSNSRLSREAQRPTNNAMPNVVGVPSRLSREAQRASNNTRPDIESHSEGSARLNVPASATSVLQFRQNL